jgi:hypothetical protein
MKRILNINGEERKLAGRSEEAAMAQKSAKQTKQEKPVRQDNNKKHLDDELNKALKDTFPGSDPVSVIQPAPSHYDKDEI